VLIVQADPNCANARAAAVKTGLQPSLAAPASADLLSSTPGTEILQVFDHAAN